MQDFVLSLSPHVESRVRIDGNYFMVLEASSPIEFLFDETGTWTRRQEGQGNGVSEYGDVFVRSSVKQSVRIALGYVGDGSPVNGAGSFTGTVDAKFSSANQNRGLPMVTVKAGKTAQIAAGNNQRLSLRLSLSSAAAGPLLLADNTNAGAGVGGLIEPGMTDYVTSTGELSAYNPNDDDVIVYGLELNRI